MSGAATIGSQKNTPLERWHTARVFGVCLLAAVGLVVADTNLWVVSASILTSFVALWIVEVGVHHV